MENVYKCAILVLGIGIRSRHSVIVTKYTIQVCEILELNNPVNEQSSLIRFQKV